MIIKGLLLSSLLLALPAASETVNITEVTGKVFDFAKSLQNRVITKTTSAKTPTNFREAKKIARQRVYFDQNTYGDLYCGCQWKWVGESGGRIQGASCGVTIRKDPERSARIEWEHIMPAAEFGRQRTCWKAGGRKNCNNTDALFNSIESDLYNLYPVVGELNKDRSDYRYGMILGEPRAYGSCDFEVDFKQRIAEPPSTARGLIARTYLYMSDRYSVRLSEKQRKLFEAWNHQYPVTSWEIERNRRIAAIVGHHNPYVTTE